MVTGKSFTEAVNLAKENPNLGVGLHLVLCCGKSVLSPAEIPNLVDKKGFFSNNPTIAGLRYQFNPKARLELRKEIKAQLKKFSQTGLTLSHVDGHLHLHTHPVILNILTELAVEFKIKFIRLPYEELSFTLNIDKSNLFTKIIHNNIFNRLYQYGKKRLTFHNINYPEKVYGLLQTGKVTESYLLKLIPQITADFVEIYAHPSMSNLDSNSKEELEAFCSKKCKDMLISKGFKLTNYLHLREQ